MKRFLYSAAHLLMTDILECDVNVVPSLPHLPRHQLDVCLCEGGVSQHLNIKKMTKWQCFGSA